MSGIEDARYFPRCPNCDDSGLFWLYTRQKYEMILLSVPKLPDCAPIGIVRLDTKIEQITVDDIREFSCFSCGHNLLTFDEEISNFVDIINFDICYRHYTIFEGYGYMTQSHCYNDVDRGIDNDDDWDDEDDEEDVDDEEEEEEELQ